MRLRSTTGHHRRESDRIEGTGIAPEAEPTGPPRIHDSPDLRQWDPIRVDQPTVAYESRPAPGRHGPDTICDAWATPDLVVRLASVRGDAHRFGGHHRQDHATAVLHPATGTVLFAVMDGVSSASHAHLGAEIAGDAALSAMWTMLDERSPIDWRAVLSSAANRLVRHRPYGMAEQENLADVERRLGTTIVAGKATRTEAGLTATMVRVGDSGAWVLRRSRYTCLFAGKAGEDSTIDSAVRALPRLPDRIEPVEIDLPPDAVLLVATDGIGDALGDGTGLIGQLFAQTLEQPPPGLGFAHVIGFSRETFDDDRTMLAVWPRTGRKEFQT